MVNSRDKGERGEREWRDELRAEGYEAHRGCQYSGKGADGSQQPDVVCKDLKIHWEVKRTNRLNLRKAIAQAKADAKRAGLEHWSVAWREDYGEWIMITSSPTYFAAIRGDFA